MGERERGMIEKTIRDYLVSKLGTNNIFFETPNTFAGECVVIQIIDRTRENLIDAVTASIYSYAESKYDSAVLDEKVRIAMRDFDGEEDISSCRISGGSDAPDTTLKKYRYRSNFNIVYMEV